MQTSQEAGTWSAYDRYLFHQGTLYRSYQTFGAHLVTEQGVAGVRFTVWAPNAVDVRVVGDFNAWDGRDHRMELEEESGVWTRFFPELGSGTLYKYEIHTTTGEVLLKADPYAFHAEVRPQTASIVCELDGYVWQDAAWQARKRTQRIYHEPVLIYEVHLGSWKRKPDGSFLTYREFAAELVPYVRDLGFTHLELMPVLEHPYDRSWGYQATGYYAPTSRFGTPQDLMYLIDACHQAGLGVILDWVPAHFTRDAHGLRTFDGTPLYEYADPMKADKGEWGTLSFDFGRPEVAGFLIANALYWMDVYHIDGLRVDAVASMLYLDYGKEPGQWVPNRYGGRENIEAIQFLRQLNAAVFEYHPHALMMAEESTTWPMVSAPIYLGGLGFNFKWNMGWMNDALQYLQKDPIHRKYHHNLLTFSFSYAFSENYVLSLSHDEVVHGKRSLLDKMPGDYWQKFAGLRTLYGFMTAHPGKQLLFMGGEFGQFAEWKDEGELDWGLLTYELHRQMQDYVRDLHAFYRREPSLWELDHQPEGFAWIDPHDYTQSIITFLRKGRAATSWTIIVCNMTPVVRQDYRIGVPELGTYRECFNSDQCAYGGSGVTSEAPRVAEASPWHNQPHSLRITVPPLAVVMWQLVRATDPITECSEGGHENEE